MYSVHSSDDERYDVVMDDFALIWLIPFDQGGSLGSLWFLVHEGSHSSNDMHSPSTLHKTFRCMTSSLTEGGGHFVSTVSTQCILHICFHLVSTLLQACIRFTTLTCSHITMHTLQLTRYHHNIRGVPRN